MEKVKGRFLAKCLMVAVIILTMLFSSFMPILSWAIEGNEGDETQTETEEQVDPYISLTYTWNSDSMTESNDVTTSYGSKTAYFKVEFNTIQTGFTGTIKFKAEDGITSDFSRNNTGGSSIFSGASTTMIGINMDAGTVGTGFVDYTIEEKENEDFQRHPTIVLTGSYYHEGQRVEVNIEKTLNIKVQGDYSAYAMVSFPTERKGYNRDYEGCVFDGLSIVTKSYSLNVKTGNFTQYAKIKVKGFKSGNSDINNLPIEIDVHPGDAYTVSQYDAEEGSITFERGNKDAEYGEAELFGGENDIAINVKYNMTGEDNNVEGQRGIGYYFSLQLSAEIEAVGYRYHYGPDGNEYTKETIDTNRVTASAACNTNEFIEVDHHGNVVPNRYGTDILKSSDYTDMGGSSRRYVYQYELNQFISSGEILIDYLSSFNLRNQTTKTIGKTYVYNYNFTEEDANIEGINKNRIYFIKRKIIY